ncbi:Down syndrome cell adhesion molecule-like protein 1, variant 2 [Chamberlinius hualienensis]
MTSFTWFKNGKPILADVRVGFTSAKILTISEAERGDQGMYQCFVCYDEFSSFDAAEIRLGRVFPTIISHFTHQAVLAGAKVSLKCVATSNSSPTIVWTRDDQPVKPSLYSSFVTSTGDVVSYLNITSVRVEDGGEYRCVASNRAGESSHTGKLNIIGPPFIRPMKNVTVVSGQTAVVSCRVTGYPIRSVTWKKGDVPLPIDPRQEVHPNGTMQIMSVDKNFDEGLYTCTATNDRDESASGTVAITVTVPPQIAPFSFPPKLHVGTRARLQCVVTDGDLPITFLWTKDGQSLTHDLELVIKQDDEFSSSLTFQTIQTKHNGNYTCVARNAAVTTNFSANLVVDVPPYWIIQPLDTSVPLGKSVILPCSADGYPKPHVVWKKAFGIRPENFKDLFYANDKYKVFGNGSLLVQKASELDEGHYLCHAKNGIGPGLNRAAFLSVEAAVWFDLKLQNLTSKKGDTVSLLCIAKGDAPIKSLWNLNGLKIDANVDYRYVIKESFSDHEAMSVLEINNVDIRDSGTYSCHASNSYGRDETIFHLDVRDVPDAPENVKIAEYFSRNVRLTWVPPFDGGSPITQYMVQYKNGSEDWGAHHLNVTVNHPEVTTVVRGLRPGIAYRFRLIAINAVGAGKPSNGVGIRTTEEAPSAPPVDIEARAETSQSVRVTWKPPLKEHWNGDIIGYTVGYREFGPSDPYIYRDTEINVSKHLETVISGLSKYTKYFIVVRARNRIGSGPLSEEIVVETFEDVPAESPSDIKCTSSSPESLDISWNPPPKTSQNGVIQNYKLIYRPVFQLHATKQIMSVLEVSDAQERVLSPTVLSTVIQPLNKYTNYSIQMQAATRVGDGAVSQPIFCVTREDVPGPPADIKAITMSSDTILVTWKLPLSPNGEIVTYTVYFRQSVVSSKENQHQVSRNVLQMPTKRVFIAQKLQDGARYEFWVTSSTKIGEGSSTRVISQIAQAKAAAGIASFSSRVFYHWQTNVSLPCPASGQPPPKLSWTLRNVEKKNNDRISQDGDGTLHIQRVQRQDGGNYTCSAKNVYGNDHITYELVVLAPPPPPQLKLTKVTSNSIELHIRPTGDGGIPIKGYVLSYKELKGKWEEVRVEAGEDKVTLKSLKCGTNYQMYITGLNEVGIGEPSAILPAMTKGTVPSIPNRNYVVEANVSAITLHLYRWQWNECPIQHFAVHYRRPSSTTWTLAMDNVPYGQKSVVLSSLESGTAYQVKVIAFSEAGASIAPFDVTTLIYVKGPNGTLIMAPSQPTGSSPFYEDMSIVIPAISSAIATIVLLIGICVCFHRQKTQVNEKTQNSDSQPLKFENDRAQRYSATSGVGSGDECMQLQPMVDGQRKENIIYNEEDVCPYATSRVIPCYRSPSPVSRRRMDISTTGSRNSGLTQNEDHREKRLHAHHAPYAHYPEDVRDVARKNPLLSLSTACHNDHQQTTAYYARNFDANREDTKDSISNASKMKSNNDTTMMISSANMAAQRLSSQSWDNLTKCLHRYPDLIYNGPDSETSDEIDFDDVSYSAITLSGKMGFSRDRNSQQETSMETTTLEILEREEEKDYPVDPRLISNYYHHLLRCQQPSSTFPT